MHNIQIRNVGDRKTLRDFLDIPYQLYRGEAHWHPPLRMERAEHIDPKHNPALANIERELFVAYSNGRPVGRVAVFLNHVHRTRYQDGAAHFGFFDCIEDAHIAQLLLTQAETWAGSREASKLIGPSEWSVNETCGLLIDGFDTPNVIMMPHGRADYPVYLEQAGFTKAVDLIAFQNALHEGYPRPKLTQRMVAWADKDPSIEIRALDTRHLHDEIRLAMDIFNDAWSDNWGFLPWSAKEVDHMAKSMKPLLFDGGFLFGLIDGEPVAFICMIPDIHEAARDLDGKLLPFGWAKLLWRLKTKKIRQARVPLMGLKKDWHNHKRGLAVIAALCETVFENGRKRRHFTHCELSWILDSNQSMIRIAEQASSVPYKTYRMYEKALS